MSTVLLQAHDLVVDFPGRASMFGRVRAPLRAINRVSLAVSDGEVLGLVGESGCGKSTLARTLLGIQRETSGTLRLDGQLVSGLPPRNARRVRRSIQYVHQDPGAALDPWWRIGDTLHEGLKINGVKSRDERERRIAIMLEAVGLDPSFLRRYPHELSGGQQRRVGLARILVLEPRMVLLDEPTSGLDLSVQATVLRLIRDLQAELKLTYLFISHDLSVVQRMCQRVAIMYLGSIVEIGDVASIFERPQHPYTQALLAASPRLQGSRDTAWDALPGDPPSPTDRPSGCAFRTRCPIAQSGCAEAEPPLRALNTPGHEVACVRAGEASPVSSLSPRGPGAVHRPHAPPRDDDT